MKAISVKQPWAHLIIHGGKDIENRTWNTKIRGRVLIHASKNIDEDAMEQFSDDVPHDVPRGGIIGSVEIVDVVRSSNSDWFQGPVGFVLKDPQPLPFKECKGRLNFFEVKE